MRFRDALVLLACTCLVGCDETKHTHYATGIDAVKDGAIARGWLPEVLSSNVVDIDESHDLDINHGKADFKYAAELIPKLQKSCVSSQPEHNRLVFQCGSFKISLDPTKSSGHLLH